MVIAFKRCMSDFKRHGIAPAAPITPLSATATMRTISIRAQLSQVPRAPGRSPGTPATESGEIDEPDGETGGLAIPFGDLAEQKRVVAEQRGIDHRFGGFDLVQEFLVLGEFADQGQNKSGLGRPGATDVQ